LTQNLLYILGGELVVRMPQVLVNVKVANQSLKHRANVSEPNRLGHGVSVGAIVF
jgi:hypothetical protein